MRCKDAPRDGNQPVMLYGYGGFNVTLSPTFSPSIQSWLELGGIYAVKSGFDKRAEIKMHTESLKQLGDSFQAEVQPMVVDIEGRTLQLKGSAEEQYAEWRRLLHELYKEETGLVPTAPAAPAADAKDPAAQSSGTG